jgi:hypothetical protein
MTADVLLGACSGLMLSALLIVSCQECARWLLAQVDGPDTWTPPVSGAVTGTGIFFAIASIWLLIGA